VVRLGRGSPRSEFDAFVADSMPRLIRIAYLLTWNVGDAEDLVQETLARVARHWLRVRKMEHPFAYARQILANLAVRSNHRRAREVVGLKRDDDPEQDRCALVEDPRATQIIEQVDARAELTWMLAALPRRQRTVLVLRYFADLSEQEIAEELDWPAGTVKSTAARALARLQLTVGSGMDGALRRSGSDEMEARTMP
jgi:RNA polymerase sigma-70 factor (sigma-E family)